MVVYRFQVSGLYSLPSFKMIIGCLRWQGREKKTDEVRKRELVS